MKKKSWMLLILLVSSFFLISCTRNETNVNGTVDLSSESTEISVQNATPTETEIFYISYNGEIQQFDVDNATGLMQNIKSLAWLAPRGGLEMELIDEDVSEEENIYIYQSNNWENIEDSNLVWLRISNLTDVQNKGEGTSIPENQDTLVYIQDQDMYVGIQNSNLKWEIWKLTGYGDWLEKEIRIFIRVVTGL